MPTRNDDYGVTDGICKERRCDLRKILDEKIETEGKLRTAADETRDARVALLTGKIEHERELRTMAFTVRDEALISQAKEYERRLEENNDQLRQNAKDRGNFFTKEAHEQFAIEYRRFRDETRQHETTVRTWGTVGVITLGLLQFAIQLIVHLWGK
jgi:hypothetical protein